MSNKCGKPCKVYSRVNGYLRDVSSWNKGKQEEFKNRKPFNFFNKNTNFPVKSDIL